MSSAAICCVELLQPVSCSLPEDEFVRALYAVPSRCLEASLTFALWAGCSTVDRVLGKSLAEVLPQGTGSREIFRRWRSLSLSTQGFEADLERPAGRRRTCQSVIYGRISNEQLSRIWVVLRDITPQSRALKALSVSENHYRSLVERPGLLFVRIRPDGTYEHMSRTAQETLGISLEEANVTPCTVFRLVHPDDAQRAQAFIDARNIGSLRVVEDEHRLKTKDGKYRWFLVRQFPKRNSDGEIESYDIVAVDIHLQREIAHRAENLSSTSVSNELSAGLAHDLNNFLAIAMAQLGSASAALLHSPPVKLALDGAQQCLEACREISRQLLEIGLETNGRQRSFSLGSLMNDTRSLLRHALPNRIALVISPPSDDLWLTGEPVQLQRALLNLVLNARDAIREQGQISIAAERTPNGDALISVRDSGPGIRPELAGRLFEPFFSTKIGAGGHGLGLVNTKLLVQSFGGRVQFRNHPEGGAEFSLMMPLPSQKAFTAPSPDIHSHHRSTGWCALSIFVVEDLADLRASMLSTLSSVGHRVIAFPDAESLVSHLSERYSPPDVCILDENLPGRSGSSLALQLGSFLPATAILLTSGAAVATQSACRNHAGLRVLPKPFSPPELLQAVAALDAKGHFDNSSNLR